MARRKSPAELREEARRMLEEARQEKQSQKGMGDTSAFNVRCTAYRKDM